MRNLNTTLLSGACLTLSAATVAAELPAQVLATYGDTITLTATDFDAAVRTLPPNVRDQARLSPKNATQLLESILLNRVLAEEARKMGLDQGAEARSELQQVTDRAMSVRRMEAFEESLTIPDYTAAAQEQYDLNKTKFVVPEQVRAAHLLIGTNGRDAAEARKLAEEVLAKAIAGADFDALVDEYSDDKGSKPKHGDLGYFARGRMVKPFEEAAFALEKPGQLSGVVKSPFGFHIIKFIDRTPARQKTFDEVKSGIIAPMRAQLVNAEKARYTSKIRNDPSIKLNTAAIDRLITPAPDTPAATPAPGKKP